MRACVRACVRARALACLLEITMQEGVECFGNFFKFGLFTPYFVYPLFIGDLLLILINSLDTRF